MMEDMEKKLAFLLARSPHFMLKGGSSTYRKAARDFIANGVVIRERGEWIDQYGERFKYKCSLCGDGNDTQDNFCPNCGADMKKEKLIKL